jgi:hypothetical protein
MLAASGAGRQSPAHRSLSFAFVLV